MRTLYPDVSPYHNFRLRVSNRHELYVEESGNPKGVPIVFLHGGPGGGLDPKYRRFFDPNAYRVILFDQRGCGQSTPFAELEENTTWHLVEDIEKIRQHLKIEHWHVFGGSWGSTLALSYSIRHPERVSALILRGIFLCRPFELHWFYQKGASFMFPDLWEKYENFIPKEERSDMMAAYHKRLVSNDEVLKLEAAQIWSTWEAATSKLLPSQDFVTEYEDPRKALPFARIEAHYFVNKAFMPTPNYLLENTHLISHIPCRIIQGRYDVVCPMKSAWDLHRSLPKSELRVVADAGHSALEPGISSELVQATDDFRFKRGPLTR